MTKQIKKLKNIYDKFYEVIWGNGYKTGCAVDFCAIRITDILSLLDAVDGVLKNEESKGKKKKKKFDNFMNLIVGLILGVFCGLLIKIILGLC